MSLGWKRKGQAFLATGTRCLLAGTAINNMSETTYSLSAGRHRSLLCLSFLSSVQRADEALARREKALVQKMEPKVREICEDFGVEHPSTSLETLEELVRPLAELVTAVQRP